MTRVTVLIAGLGDLGTRILHALACLHGVERVVAAGRDVERGTAHASQAQLIAALSGGPRSVTFERLDLEDREAVARLLRRLDPEVIVMAASRHTWWRSLAPGSSARTGPLRSLPYGAWLPVQLSLVRALMEAYKDAGIQGQIVSLPFPDAVGPALAPLGLAPHLGAGNVAEVAAKLAVTAAETEGVARQDVEVRLVMHHAAERYAFSVFGSLAGEGASRPDEPPWLAQVLVRERPLSADRVHALFQAPYPLPPGTGTHQLTAAAAVRLVAALLSDRPRLVHAPAPGGRPGGYPLLVSQAGVELALPPGIGEKEAVDLNSRAARWDGLERIEEDGTIIFTPAVTLALVNILGLRLTSVSASDQQDVADEMLRRARG